MPTKTSPYSSKVRNVPAASADEANTYFRRKLGCETDPSDVYTDIQNGSADFVLVDVRSPADYTRSHAVGALNLPHPTIDEATTAHLAKEQLIVVYCWGPGCNGATKAAVKLSALGFPVKEMIGGIEYWADKERYPVERG